MGGQLPNNLAIRLHRAGVRILGTSAESIDMAEDRRKFSALLDQLGIDQPRWEHVTNASEAERIVERLGGYPVLVRPSYVLSGAAMSVAREKNELARILACAKAVSPEHPVVVSKFETHARELEIDAVADGGEIVLWAISEHVEDAGVHSGDATLVLPPQSLYIATIRQARKIAQALAKALRITGPFNVQYLAKHNAVKVIECNLRASRSFPFVSKVTGNNFVIEAMRRMLGVARAVENHSLDLDYVAVKAPMFSFSRLVGADPMLGVEMASTGEVGCFGDDLHEALLHALLATGFKVPRKGVLLSLGPLTDKYWFADEARVLSRGDGAQALRHARHRRGAHDGGHPVHRARQAPRGRGDDGHGRHRAGARRPGDQHPHRVRRARPPRWIPHPPPGGGRGHPAHHRPAAGAGHHRGPAPPKGEGPRRPLLGRVRRAAPGGAEVDLVPRLSRPRKFRQIRTSLLEQTVFAAR